MKNYRVACSSGQYIRVKAESFKVSPNSGFLDFFVGDEIVASFIRWDGVIKEEKEDDAEKMEVTLQAVEG